MNAPFMMIFKPICQKILCQVCLSNCASGSDVASAERLTPVCSLSSTAAPPDAIKMTYWPPCRIWRSLKMCIRDRNWVMIDTVAGARSSAIIYSIAETAKANSLKPYDYFEYLLTEIPKHLDGTDRNFLDDLLPWSPKDVYKRQVQYHGGYHWSKWTCPTNGKRCD